MSDYQELLSYVKQLERRLAKLERQEFNITGGDHGTLSGLGDDDHALYLLASAAGNRTTFGTNWTDLTDAGATTLHKHDHGGQDGLSDDDHSQYALLAGRSGGQSLNGGTAANDDLTLQGTSNSTRDTSYVIIQPNGGKVGIGTDAPTLELQVLRDQNALTSIGVFNSTNDTGAGARMYTSSGASSAQIFQFAFPASATTITEFAGDAGFYTGTATEDLAFASRSAAGVMKFYTGGSASTNRRLTITAAGDVGIGVSSPGGKLDVQQTSTTAAIPTLALTQSDVSEEFIEFDGTVAAGNPIDTAAIGTYYGKVRVSVNGTFKYIALYNS